MAQSPSPEPPPWFGGRVEMPEHGFAVTVPEGWLAFGPEDLEEQVEVAADWLHPNSPDERRDIFERFSRALARTSFQLALIEQSSASTCSLVVYDDTPITAEAMAEGLEMRLSEDERVTVVAPSHVIDVPAGPGRSLEFDWAQADGPGITQVAYHLAGHEGTFFFLVCGGDERPDDAWLSIAETFEWLPKE